MIKNYTGKVSEDLEIALKEAGMDMRVRKPYSNEIGDLRPTVAQVIDWFFEKHEIGISLIPVFLGTTDDGFVWDYEIYSPRHHEKNECFEEFDRCAWFAINAALEVLNSDKK